MIRGLRLGRDTRGATVIEMAFALPALIVMMWMVIQLGLVFRAMSGIQHALGEELAPLAQASGVVRQERVVDERGDGLPAGVCRAMAAPGRHRPPRRSRSRADPRRPGRAHRGRRLARGHRGAAPGRRGHAARLAPDLALACREPARLGARLAPHLRHPAHALAHQRRPQRAHAAHRRVAAIPERVARRNVAGGPPARTSGVRRAIPPCACSCSGRARKA